MERKSLQIRIVVFPPGLDLKREIALYDPVSGKILRDGQREGPGQADIDLAVRKLKAMLERGGKDVTVKVM